MSFVVKMDDKKIKVDIESTQLKDVLIYCKPKERLVLMRKFGLDGGREVPLQKIGKEYSLTRERVRQIEAKGLRKLRNPRSKVKQFDPNPSRKLSRAY